MNRHFALFTLGVSAFLAGCATAPAPTLIERDPVDGLIAQNAASATQALRELSEASGASRVVNTGAKTAGRPIVAPAPAPAPAAVAQVEVEPEPVRAPLPAANTIAARRGTIAVEMDAPVATTVIPSSTGVVASGGLLSAPPAGLERLITVRWTGELEQLLGRVAQESGWRIGNSTGLRVAPVIISISAENRSAFDVLRDIGAIAGTSADIVVSAPTRTISVRYPQR
jgi:hypothetical protein